MWDVMVIANEEFLPEDPLDNEEDKHYNLEKNHHPSLNTNSTWTTRKGMIGVGLYALKNQINLLVMEGWFLESRKSLTISSSTTNTFEYQFSCIWVSENTKDSVLPSQESTFLQHT